MAKYKNKTIANCKHNTPKFSKRYTDILCTKCLSPDNIYFRRNHKDRKRIVYWCDSCKGEFIDKKDVKPNTKPRTKFTDIKCVKCNKSDRVYLLTRWRDGRIRYQCDNCNISFFEIKDIKDTKKQKIKCIENIECRFCNSNSNIYYSRKIQGRQRYECLDCNKSFYDKSTIKPTGFPRRKCPDIKCNSCNTSDNVYYLTKLKNNRIKYKCDTCKISFIPKESFKPRKQRTKCLDIECPKCNTSREVYYHATIYKDNRIKYKCDACNYEFISEIKTTRRGLLFDYKMSDLQKENIEGLMLGDGGLYMCNHANFKLTRSTSDIKYLEYNYNIYKNMCIAEITSRDVFDERTNKIYHTSYFCTLSTNELTDLYNKWYDKKGNKIVPLDFELTDIKLVNWYLDDGHVGIGVGDGGNNIDLYTNNFYKKEVVYLQKQLYNKYGLEFNIHKSKHTNPKKGYIIIMYGKENVLKFAKIVDPYILPEMNMSENRIDSQGRMVNKTAWRDSDNLEYLNNKISLSELNERKKIKGLKVSKKRIRKYRSKHKGE